MTSLIASTLLPPELGSPPTTLAEVLLDIESARVGSLRLDAPLVVNDQRDLVPATFVLTSEDNPLLSLREKVANRLLELPRDQRPRALKALFPPPGPVGSWDPARRLYRTRYMMLSALGPPRISEDLVRKFDLRDSIDFWKHVQLGDLCPFNEFTISTLPPELDKPWAFNFSYGDNPFPYTLSVAYRGCESHYEYPLRASAFRRFDDAADAEAYDKLKRFAGNLLTELIWSVHRVAIHPTEAESLIQHYKLLPWTYMTDLSYDANVAKAFACSSPSATQRTPTIYKVILLNIDDYELGGGHINALPFRRPAVQKAVSLVGLNSLMQDPLGVVVSVTEHPHYFGTGTLAALGGSAFTLVGCRFESLWLDESLYNKAQSLLYPEEPPETCVLLRTVIDKIRGKSDRFGLRSDLEETILARLAALERELD